MSYSTLIARRYLRSGRTSGFISFITAIAILGILLGTATLIITLSVLGGFEREITDKVIGFTTHIQVQGFHNQILRNYESHIQTLRDSIPLVRAIAPFAAREALIRSPEGVDGILLKGVDPRDDITTARRFIVEGRYDVDREKGSLPNIVIGRKLAAKLDLHVGEKAAGFAMGRSLEQGNMRVMQFRVVGIYESGMAEYDDIYAFTSLADAQTLFQLGDAVTGYEILVSNIDSVSAIADRIQDILPYPHYARTMYQSYRNLFSWIQLQKEPVPIILGLVIIVATVNIIGTLLMMVLDKTRDIGILMSMGATRRSIARIFLRQGLTIAVIGTLLGNGLALVICVIQSVYKPMSLPSDIYFMTSVPILIRPEYFLVVSTISIMLCWLCSFIPARLASRMTPVKAIRFV